jgi:Tol biopolymer transport system component
MSSGTALTAGGSLIHPEGWSAVSSDGDLVVFTGLDGPHNVDLWSSEKNAQGTWSTPAVLTGDSSYACNSQPSISADGSKVVFRCGPTPNDSGSICEVNSDGTGFRVKTTAGQIGSIFLNQPDYALDGSIVFEEAGNLEQLWRLPAGSSSPVKITNTFTNDNSPCVLPDGRIVTLWIRDSIHELKIMDADGSNYFMLIPGVDVHDIGLGCGQ